MSAYFPIADLLEWVRELCQRHPEKCEGVVFTTREMLDKFVDLSEEERGHIEEHLQEILDERKD